MHGIIFSELKKYVDSKLGGNAWNSLLTESGIGFKTYLGNKKYPDEEAVALVSTASRITGKPAGALLEDFGEFIVPDLMTVYGALIKPNWKTLDLIENTESVIHTTIRFQSPEAEPPQLT